KVKLVPARCQIDGSRRHLSWRPYSSWPRSVSISLVRCFSTHELSVCMRKPLIAFVIAMSALTSSAAFAAEKTVTLTVNNMYCADCHYIVKKSLESVPGVAKVAVSFKDKTATVTYDDSKADLKALTTATTNAGYPSALRS